MSENRAPAPGAPGAARGWTVSADASLQSTADEALCPPLLRQMLSLVLPWQTRNTTLVLRTLTSPRIAPQWLAGLLAVGAEVAVSADGSLDEFSLETVLRDRPDGTIEALRVPVVVPPPRWGVAHVSRTPADEPIVAAIAVVTLAGEFVDQVRVALTGAWPEPVRLAGSPKQLVGGLLNLERIREVAALVEKEVAPRGDFRGSEDYRREMARVMTRRALEQCLG